MPDCLKVAAIQTELYWEVKEENLDNFERLISQINEEVDLIVLPEMFTTGFTMNPSNIAEAMNGISVLWMIEMARKVASAICGSLVIKEGGQYFNRCVFVHPNGQHEIYDKRHRFTLAGEHKVYERGNEILMIDYKGWKICPLICYDLRFPVWSRNRNNYDLLIYMANWPKPRISAWDILLKARAVENMSYVIGTNRIGEDENGYVYCGHSQIVDFMGEVKSELRENEEGILVFTLDKGLQDSTRKKLNFLNDQDHFEILDS